MINFEMILDDQTFMCFLSKKSRKNINVRIKPSNQIYISKPKRVSIKQLKRYLSDNRKWIIDKTSHLNKLNNIRNNYFVDEHVFIFNEKHLLSKSDNDSIELKSNTIVINRNASKKELEQFLDRELLSYVDTIRQSLDKIIEQSNINKPLIKIKKMKGKWGSCYINKNVIYLNSKLIHYPKQCTDYVLLHEYMHLLVPNHSKNFYHLIERYMPNYKAIVKYLKTN